MSATRTAPHPQAEPEYAAIPRRLRPPSGWPVAVLLVAAVLLGVGRNYAAAVNDDVAWLVHLAELVLDGADLNTDYFEVNSPIVVYVSMLPVLVARLLGVPGVLMAPVTTAVLLLGSVALLAALYRRTLPDLSPLRLTWFLTAVVMVFFLVPEATFSQREHHALALMLPYLSAAGMTLGGVRTSRRVGILVGIVAAVGFTMKPHFVLVLVGVEGWLLVRTRSLAAIRRWEAATVIVASGLITVTLWALEPDFVNAALQLFPLYARYPIEVSWPWMQWWALLILTVAGVGHLAMFRRTAAGGIGSAYFAAAVIFAGLAVLQGKGFDYHWVPVLSMAAILLAHLVFVEPLRSGRPGLVRTVVLAGVLAEVLLLAGIRTTRQLVNGDRLRGGPITQWTELVASATGDRRVLILSGELVLSHPAVEYADVTAVLPFPSLWFLPVLYEGATGPGAVIEPRPLSAMGPEERWLHDLIVERATETRPDLILVDQRRPLPHFAGGFLDLLAYYRQDPAFDRLLEDYTESTAGDFLVLRKR